MPATAATREEVQAQVREAVERAAAECGRVEVKGVAFDLWWTLDGEPNLLVEVTLNDPPEPEGTWPDKCLRAIEDAAYEAVDRVGGWDVLGVEDTFVRFRPEHIDPRDLA